MSAQRDEREPRPPGARGRAAPPARPGKVGPEVWHDRPAGGEPLPGGSQALHTPLDAVVVLAETLRDRLVAPGSPAFDACLDDLLASALQLRDLLEQAERPGDPRRPERPHRRRSRILVVDDNGADLPALLRLLTHSGYDVYKATTGDQMWALLARLRPDLVLIDLHLGGADALELTRQLKARPDTGDLPVVALASPASAEDAERIKAAGCEGYLAGPLDSRSLPDRIAAFLAAGRRSPRHEPNIT